MCLKYNYKREFLFISVTQSETPDKISPDQEKTEKDEECDEITIVTQAPRPRSSFTVSASKLDPKYKEQIMKAQGGQNTNTQPLRIPMEQSSDFISSLFETRHEVEEKIDAEKSTSERDQSEATVTGDSNTDKVETAIKESNVNPQVKETAEKSTSDNGHVLSSKSSSGIISFSGSKLSRIETTALGRDAITALAGLKLAKIQEKDLKKAASIGTGSSVNRGLLKSPHNIVLTQGLLARSKMVQVHKLPRTSLTKITETMSINNNSTSKTSVLGSTNTSTTLCATSTSKLSQGQTSTKTLVKGKDVNDLPMDITTVAPLCTSMKPVVIMSPASKSTARRTFSTVTTSKNVIVSPQKGPPVSVSSSLIKKTQNESSEKRNSTESNDGGDDSLPVKDPVKKLRRRGSKDSSEEKTDSKTPLKKTLKGKDVSEEKRNSQGLPYAMRGRQNSKAKTYGSNDTETVQLESNENEKDPSLESGITKSGSQIESLKSASSRRDSVRKRRCRNVPQVADEDVSIVTRRKSKQIDAKKGDTSLKKECDSEKDSLLKMTDQTCVENVTAETDKRTRGRRKKIK